MKMREEFVGGLWRIGNPGLTVRCFKGDSTPATRDLYQETSDELKAKVDMAPSVLAAEQSYRPAYTALELQSLRDALRGTAAGTRTETYTDTEVVPEQQRWVPGTPGTGAGMGIRGGTEGHWETVAGYTRPVVRTRQVATEGTPGLLDLTKDVSAASDEMEAASARRMREQEIADVERLGSRSLAAERAADPMQGQLVDSFSEQALRDLEAGSSLTPAELRNAQQTLRMRRAGTLGGTGTAGDFNEVLGISEFGQRLKQARQASAASAVGLRQGTYGSALQRVLGRGGSNAGQYMQQAAGISKSLGPQLFGSSINANDVYSSNANAEEAARISSNNNKSAQTGAYIGAGASVAAGIAMAL